MDNENLRRKLIRLAHQKPELRKHLIPLLKRAMEFDTPEMLERYMREHPDADASNHWVKKRVPKPPKHFVRPHTYRGKDGFMIGGGGNKIFVRKRETAEVIKKLLTESHAVQNDRQKSEEISDKIDKVIREENSSK